MPRFKPSNTGYRNRQQAQFDSACNRPKPPITEYLCTVAGYKVIATAHSTQRTQQRQALTKDELCRWFLTAAGDLETIINGLKEYNQEVFVFNRQFRQGMILAFRRDFKDPSNRALAIVMVTVYPYGKATPMHKDTEVYYVG